MSSADFGQALRQARRGRGLSLRAMQALVQYDFTYLGQVERGEKPGSVDLAHACDHALDQSGGLVEAFGRSQDGVRGPVIPAARTAVDQDRRAGSGVQGLERALERLRHQYHHPAPPAALMHEARTQLEASTRLLERTSGVRQRQRLLRGRGEAAVLCGRLAFFDTCEPVTARGYFVTAYEAASQAGDDALAVSALGHLAFVPARERAYTVARDYLAGAGRHARRLGLPALRSWLAAVEAETMAGTDPGAGLRALDRADRALAEEPGQAAPEWFDFYSPARLEGFRGYVLMTLGRGKQARQTLRRALTGLEPDAAKQRSVLLLDLAGAHLTDPCPDIDQACGVATQALDAVHRTGYDVAAARFARLRSQLEPWRDTRAVRALDDRADALSR